MSVVFRTSEKCADFYVAIMSLGVLRSMRTGAIPLEYGIWSLGRPNFWSVFERGELISDRLLDVVHQMDEIAASLTIGGLERSNKHIDELESELLSILQAIAAEESKLLQEKKGSKGSLILTTSVDDVECS